MSSHIRSRLILSGIATVIVGLGLNYHKDMIQLANIRTVIAQGLDKRLIPHRVNRTDKLLAVLADGITSMETDLLLRPGPNGLLFEIGHDISDASGIPIDSFLNILQPHEPVKMWLDIKQARDENIDAIIAELDRLDSAYGIRSAAIIETNVTTGGLRRLSTGGYHTSYYLSTSEISHLMDEDNQPALKSEAIRLAQQVEIQSLSAISFDLALYSFVKQHLEPLLPDSIVYHTWGDLKMWQWNAVEEIIGSDYFKDARVKTILFRYWVPDRFASLCLSLFR